MPSGAYVPASQSSADPNSTAFSGTSTNVFQFNAGTSIPVQMPTERADYGQARIGALPVEYAGGGFAHKSASALLSDFESQDNATVESIQRLMYQAGPGVYFSKSVYAKRNPTPIDWGNPGDPATTRAYTNLLRAAHKAARPPDLLLADQVDAAKGKYNPDAAATAGTGAPFSPVLTNPDDLRAVIQAGAEKVLGGRANVSDAEIAQITAAYQQQQLSAQQSAYNNQTAGGASNAAPSPDVFAENALRAAYPERSTAVGINAAGNEFLKLLSQVEGKPI